MKKVKASTAKSNADAALTAHDQKILSDIYEKVDAASKKGLYKLTYNKATSLAVQNTLRGNGYLVSQHGGYMDSIGIELVWTSPTA